MYKLFIQHGLFLFSLLCTIVNAFGQYEGGNGGGHMQIETAFTTCNSFFGNAGSGQTAVDLELTNCFSYFGSGHSGHVSEHLPTGGDCMSFVGDSSSGHGVSTSALTNCNLFEGGDFSGHNQTHYVNPFSCLMFTESINGGSGHHNRSFSDDNVDCYIMALGVNASPLYGEIIDGKGRLYWTTFSERNNQGFQIWRTKDGLEWEQIGFVTGRGNAQETIQYEFWDEGPIYDGYYYQYIQVDFSQVESASNIIYLQTDEQFSMKDVFVLHPNPSLTGTSIQLSTYLSKEWDVNVMILDPMGRIIMQEQMRFNGTESIQLPTENLASGTYYLYLKTVDGKQDLKITFVIIG